MYFKGIDLTSLNNKDIYVLLLERKIPIFPPGFWCSVSKEKGKEIAIELLRYLIDERLRLKRIEVLNIVNKEFILDSKLWTPCKLYFGRSAIKYVVEAYPGKYREFEFNNSRIPQGYWAIRENRVEAIRWLLEEKFKWSLEDIKEGFNRDVLIEYGLATITAYYTSSIEIVEEAFGDKIKPWELKKASVQASYWDNKENRIRAVKWLVEEKLNFSKEQLINELTIEHFYNNRLTTLICNYYNNSLKNAILEAFNDCIRPWEVKYNRLTIDDARDATIWLIDKMKKEKGKLKSEINYYDFEDNNLRYIIDKYYSSSPKKAISDAIR